MTSTRLSTLAAQKAVREVAEALEDTLTATNHAIDVSLPAVVPLPGGFPPRLSLVDLAGLALAPEPVTAVQPIKPLSRWPHEVRRAIESLLPPCHATDAPIEASARSRDIVQVIEQHLGNVRIAGEIERATNERYFAAWHRDLLLVTYSHIAVLSVRIDD